MKQYKGFYIDNIIFNNKAEIDAHIKDQAVKAYRQACEWFLEKPSMELSIYCSERAEHLHKVIGMTWEQIEQIELNTYKAGA